MKLYFFASVFCLFSLNLSGQCPVYFADSEGILSDSEGILWTGDETNCELEKPKPPLSIFPNPTSDYFEIRNSEGTEGYLFDVQGRLIRRFRLNDQTTIVDISDLPCAMYIIRVNHQFSKIIKI